MNRQGYICDGWAGLYMCWMERTIYVMDGQGYICDGRAGLYM